MQNGLYIVRFETPLGQGSGVVVVRDGSIGGGDTGTYYRGSYTTGKWDGDRDHFGGTLFAGLVSTSA